MQAWVQGRPRRAAGLWETVLARHPMDLLALRCAHDVYLSLGDHANLRASPSRVLSSWRPDVPGYHYALSMHAYGMHAAGAHDEAEETALRALETDPSDAWAVHAAVHVMESTGRAREGVALCRDTAEYWRECRHLRGHLEAHWAMLLLDQGYTDMADGHLNGYILTDVMGVGANPGSSDKGGDVDGTLFPEPIGPSMLDVSSAAAVLWRIQLQLAGAGEGAGVVPEGGGERWGVIGRVFDRLDRPKPWGGWETTGCVPGVARAMVRSAQRNGETVRDDVLRLREQHTLGGDGAGGVGLGAAPDLGPDVPLPDPAGVVGYSVALDDALVGLGRWTAAAAEDETAATAVERAAAAGQGDGGAPRNAPFAFNPDSGGDAVRGALMQGTLAEAVVKYGDGDYEGSATLLLATRNNLNVAGMDSVDSRVLMEVRVNEGTGAGRVVGG